MNDIEKEMLNKCDEIIRLSKELVEFLEHQREARNINENEDKKKKCQCTNAEFTRTVNKDFEPICGRCGKNI